MFTLQSVWSNLFSISILEQFTTKPWLIFVLDDIFCGGVSLQRNTTRRNATLLFRYKNIIHNRFVPNVLHSKTVPWCSPMHKEGNEQCFIYTIKYDCCHKLSPCSGSMLITYTFRVTKRHPVNISFLKKTSASHYRGTIGLAVIESK